MLVFLGSGMGGVAGLVAAKVWSFFFKLERWYQRDGGRGSHSR